MPVVLEKRGAGSQSVCLLEQLRGDWAEMRVLQWFRGVCPHQVLEYFDYARSKYLALGMQDTMPPKEKSVRRGTDPISGG